MTRGDDKSKSALLESELVKEISWSESDLLRAFFAYGQNPDPVARVKGLTIYRDMMEDDQVKACVELRKQARLSTPWAILSGKEGDAEADKMADFVRHVIKRMRGTFEDDLYEIYSAIEYGFSVSEMVYKIIEDGPFAGKIGLEAIKTREPFNYDFKVDEHGNLLGIVYTGITPNESDVRAVSGIVAPDRKNGRIFEPRSSGLYSGYLGSMENPFPTEKFIVYSYNMQFGNWYGRSDLFAAFRSWLIKKHVFKFWAVWLERYASPFIWAQVKAGAGMKPKALEEIDAFLRLVGTRNAIRVSDDVTLNPVQFSTAGGDAYEKAVEAHNRFISHAILCPNLIGVTGSQGTGGSGGTYALGRKHFDAFVWVLEKMGRDTSETIVGEQIIKRLININFPNVDNDMMPRFVFEGVEEDSIESRARIVTMLAGGGFLDPGEDWVRGFLTLPKVDENAASLKAKKKIRDEEGEIESGEDNEEDEDEEISGKEKSEAGHKTEKELGKSRKIELQKREREPNRFEEKMRVRAFALELGRGEEAFMAALTDVMGEIRDDMVAQVERKRIVESGDPKAVEQIKMNVGPLKDSLRRWLVKFHLDAKLGALEELGRSGVEVEVSRSFAAANAPFEPWTPLPPQEAVDFFNRKVKARVRNRGGKKVLVEIATRREIPYYDEKAFAISGVVRDDLLNDAKQALLNGIKRQDRIGAVKDLKEVFDKYLQSGVEVGGDLLSPHRLQTIVRTNMVEAVNEGRRAMYEDESVAGFVEYWEYTAIMDDRTTDYCQCMDGKVFRMEDLPMLNPPSHFNCRSFSVPVTRFEIEDLAKEGRGVEIAEPCPDRASGFNLRIPPLEIIPSGVLDIVAPDGKSPASAPETPEGRLRRQLELIVVRCPYKLCHSDKIRFSRAIFNVGEFQCDSCGLPFRVSNAGDIYLYDAGIERWERVTMGLNPNFFQESVSGITVCPYKPCRSSEIAESRKIAPGNVTEYVCRSCKMPFRVSADGGLYLYDAGTETWMKSAARR